ncbi:MAG: hypothetical protein ACRCVS_05035 [Fusobacteriaceae bacterium]
MTNEQKEKNIKTNKKIFKVLFKIILVLVVLFIVLAKCSGTNEKTDENKAVKVVEKKKEYKTEYTTPYIEFGDKNIASAILYYLENKLEDKTGFEIVSTSALLELDNGTFLQHITFKSKNSYGVFVNTEKSFVIRGVGFETEIIMVGNRDEVDKAIESKKIKIGKGHRETGETKVEIK